MSATKMDLLLSIRFVSSFSFALFPFEETKKMCFVLHFILIVLESESLIGVWWDIKFTNHSK